MIEFFKVFFNIFGGTKVFISIMKKTYNISKLFIAVLFIVFVAAGCSKARVEHKVEGTWDKVWVENLSTINKETWVFKPDNTLIIMRNFYNATPMYKMDTVEVGRWHIEMETKKNPRRLEIYDFKDGNVSYYNGTWLIIKANDDELFIVNKTVGRLFREFQKQKT